MLNILLGNIVSWKSCGCYFGICSKHYYRPSTPIAMALPAAGYILQNTKPQILRNGFRNATKNTRCWSSLHTPLKESTYNVRVENTTEPHCPYLSMQVTQKCVVLMLWHFFLILWVLLAPLMLVFWVCTSYNFLKYAVNVQQNQQVLNWHCVSFITKPLWYTSPFVLTNYRDYSDQYLYIFRCHTAKTTTTVQCRTLLPRAAFSQSIRSSWFYQQISIES